MTASWFVQRDMCPVCESDAFRGVYECRYDDPPISEYLIDFYSPQGEVELEYVAGASYLLCECQSCAALFQRYIPNNALMERLYEHWLNPWKALGHGQENEGIEFYAEYAQEVMQIIAFIGKMPATLDFLDFGMGWGQWSLMAKAFGCRSAGTELSEVRIEYARSNGIPCIGWEEIAQHRFDFINTEQVFEHIPEPLETLRYLKKALKPNGILKVSVPPAHDIGKRLITMDWKAPAKSRRSLNAIAPLEHINCFTRTSLSTMAARAGMREVQIPIRTQYAYSTGWCGPKRIARNLIRPVLRNRFRRQNYVLLMYA